MKKLASSIVLILCFVLTFSCAAMAAETKYGYDPDAAVKYAEENWDSEEGVCDQFVKACLDAAGVFVRAGGVEPLKNALMDAKYGTSYEKLVLKDGAHANRNDNPTTKPGDILFFSCTKCNVYIHTAIVAGFDENGNIQAYGHNPGWNKESNFGYLTFTTSDGVVHKEAMEFSVVHMDTTKSTHNHKFTEDLYEDAHPHKMYDKCACGTQYYLGWGATVSTCTTCNPPLGDKPVVTAKANADGSITLQWSTVENTKTYKVSRAKSQAGPWFDLRNELSTTFVNSASSVEPDVTYYYKVTAILNSGKESASEVVTCKFTTGGSESVQTEKPVVTATVNDNGSISLKWTIVKDADCYRVSRAKSENGTYFKLFEKLATTMTNSSSSVEPGVVYYYKVAALRDGEVISESDVVSCSVPTQQTKMIRAFVGRLYSEILGREADEGGLTAWTNQLIKGNETGVSAAYGFVFSAEFLEKNLCNEDYVKQLYKAFLGREADAGGLAAWVSVLESGRSREHVFNGFALSVEFAGLCETYEIIQGKGVDEFTRGTVPTGPCTVCGKQDPVVYEEGVVSFVRRMYLVCLGRDADPSGLESWSANLREQKETGRDVVYGFMFSEEFIKKNYSNADYVEYLYKAFMGRGSDPSGKAAWVGQLDSGVSRLEVFEGFVESEEFTKICDEYGIRRN